MRLKGDLFIERDSVYLPRGRNKSTRPPAFLIPAATQITTSLIITPIRLHYFNRFHPWQLHIQPTIKNIPRHLQTQTRTKHMLLLTTLT